MSISHVCDQVLGDRITEISKYVAGSVVRALQKSFHENTDVSRCLILVSISVSRRRLNMVKAETKFAGEKPPSCESTQGNFQVKMVDDERKVPEISEEVVVKSQDERQRRTPRTGVYIFLLVVVLLVGFLVVYVIQKTNR